tara:strand:- start:2093 stop:3442 length:1350 start_codon:yes stop_codon:yes gene_type:complete
MLSSGANTSYILKSAVITDRLGRLTDIANVMSQFVIYEHIDKPYITAQFAFLDQENILVQTNILGGESLNIVLYDAEEKLDGEPIEKSFLIDQIQSSVKVEGEQDEMVVFHCTEIHALHSSLQNVNFSYDGSVTEIISKICSNFLDKDVTVIGENITRNLRLIVPNMHPIEACLWLKERALTTIGMPFYFHSTMTQNDLILKDLGTMLSQVPVNKDSPYFYTSALQSSPTRAADYAIQSYEYNNTENLLRAIRKGYVGGKYTFYNSLHAQSHVTDFDLNADTFAPLIRENALGNSNIIYNYADDYSYKDRVFHDYKSVNVFKFTSNSPYATVNGTFNSYQEEDNEVMHKKKIIADSIEEFIAKSPLTITVPAREFVTSKGNQSIGQTLNVQFLDTMNPVVNDRPMADAKKSGNYVIFAAQHRFTGTKSTSKLLLGKVSQIQEEMSIASA